MNDLYIFHEGDLPSDYRLDFQGSIFNSAAYRHIQSSDGWTSLYILQPHKLTVHGQLHLHIKDNLAVSPLRGPFGSVEFSNHLPASVLFDFLEFAELRIRTSGVSRILIKNAPDAYFPEQSDLLQTFLLNLGYQIMEAEAGAVIRISDKPFGELIHPRKKRKLNQSKRDSLTFRFLGPEYFPEVYQFILDCRKTKNYTLSVTFHDLERTVKHFVEEYLLFGVFHEKKLVAASVAVRINKNVLYHFMSDHIRKVNAMAPALILMEGIYDYCVSRKIEILDLGTSTSQTKPNFSLLNFKSEMGGRPTVKFTFAKDLV